MKVVVVKLGCPDEKIKQKAMQSVSGLSGVVSIAVDTKDQKLTVIGDIDPVAVMGKLRKLCHSEIVTVGPVKEPEKKKEEPKKEEPAKKVEPKKEDDPKKKEDQAQLLKAYQARQQAYYQNAYYQAYQQPPAMATPAYFNRSVEEDPNGCVIS